MSKFIKIGTVVAVVAVLLGAPAYAESPDTHFYSNQTPYGDPASTEVKPAPAGYSMLFIETIGRHGSRSLTSSTPETRALNLWKAAKKKNAVTTVGKRFPAELANFQYAERYIGYGNLSYIGGTEWAGIGRRTAVNYSAFLQQAKANNETIAMVNTSYKRTRQSADFLQKSLTDAVPGLNVTRASSDSMILTSGSLAIGNSAIASIKASWTVRNSAKNVLRRLYSKKFVDSIKDPVAQAMDIYLLYTQAPGMAGHTRVRFTSYVPLADAYILGYMKDAENFYRYGPGVSGQTSSFLKAKPLLADFFAQLNARIAGGKTAAVFRVAHGETTMPFAALIKARGSEVQASRTKVYTYRNPWRGYIAGRAAGNIEWVAYKNGAGNVLVTMRYNEEPVQFHAGCTPTETGGYFYELETLEACLPH